MTGVRVLVIFILYGLARWPLGKCVPAASARRMPIKRLDFLLVAGICLLYGGFAFWKLGIREAPVTEYPLGAGIELDFGENVRVKTLNWYLKDSARHRIALESRASADEPWQNRQEIFMERAFCWGSVELNLSGRYFRLTSLTDGGAYPASAALGEQAVNIAELVIQDEDGNVIIPVNAASMAELFDETALLPQVMDYQSGAYFDEGYYTRTAYEFLHGLRPYEITHPPLGKVFIALGAACFGTSPFGFRIVGTVFGILMLPFLYLFGRNMTGSRLLGGFACFLFAFDFMHFTQTRIATIDVYITFFTILMFYFMYQYSRMSFYDTALKRTFLPLGACGLSFGLGIACKWTGFYAGAGLAVLFFRVLYLRYREYLYASGAPDGSSNGITHTYIIGHFWKNTIKTLVFCVIFFLAIPFLLYLLSYLPFADGTDEGLLMRMWKNQNYMFSYHAGLDAEHPYASPWYQWPLMIRPVFYYARSIDDVMKQGISAFGNPLVWWAGIPALVYMVYLWLHKKDKNAAFLCTAYAYCYLPWCFVTRCTFAYHYFPCVPLVCLMIMYSLAQWRGRLGFQKSAALAIGYGAMVFGLFLAFYPVLSGQPVSGTYVAETLRWLDSWVLVQYR